LNWSKRVHHRVTVTLVKELDVYLKNRESQRDEP